MVDRWLDTTPIFMVVFFVFALVGQTVEKCLRPTDLARILNLTNAALTSRVTKLVANGLITGKQGGRLMNCAAKIFK